jgi:hypothetical protein
VRFMVSHFGVEVAHVLQVLSYSHVLRDEEINVRIYLVCCSSSEIEAFSEIYIALHCLPLRE